MKCLADLKTAGFNIYKFDKVLSQEDSIKKTKQDDKDKEVICMFSYNLAQEAIQLMTDCNDQFKNGVLFDPSCDLKFSMV